VSLARWPAVLIGLGFAAALIFSVFRIADAVDTDIMSLLPADRHDPVLAAAVVRASEVASNRVVFVIEGATPRERRAAIDALSASLTDTGHFNAADVDGEALWKWLFFHRATLLCPDDRVLLETSGGSAIVDDALRQWYAPSMVGMGGLLKSDPFLLTNRLLGCLAPGAFTSDVPAAEMLSGSISASVFRLDVQDDIAAAVASWRMDWEPKGLVLLRGGAIFHATHGAMQARAEVSLIGGITLGAIFLLYWLTFRTLRAPVLAIIMVAYALATGLAVTLLVFSNVHVMALVFGAALIGMVIDYTTYYLVTGIGDAPTSQVQRRAHLFKPLTLGMLTSVGAFAALLVFPVPAFRQMAVFGMSGLIAAWLATFWVIPLVEGGRMSTGPGAAWISRRAGYYLARTPGLLWRGLVILLALLMLAVGWRSGGTLDDVRGMQAPSQTLGMEEARLRELSGFEASNAFILVRGDSAADAIRGEEMLLALFPPEDAQAIIFAASRLDPSDDTKARDAELLETRLIAPFLPKLMAELGTNGSNAYEADDVGQTNLPALVASLRGEVFGVHWSLMPVTRTVTLPSSGAGAWQFVDPADLYSALFEEYRRLATFGVAAACFMTGLMLLGIYREFSALWVLLPALLAVIITPTIVTMLGLPFSFFSAMGLFLVLGAGVDYAIFQREHPGETGKWTRVGIVLAALMTCISLGLLGLSSVLPVRSFGVTVAVGIFVSLALSPFARGRRADISSEDEIES